MPASAAPSILNKSYTITAEVEIPEGGAEGMIVTEGGRFGGYGLFLSKGVAGIRPGQTVFLYNLLNLKRTIWSGPELGAGKHTIVFDFKSDGPGLGKGGTGVLSVDGKEVDQEIHRTRHADHVPGRRNLRRRPGHPHRRRDDRVSLRSSVQVHRQDPQADVQARTGVKDPAQAKAELGPTAAPEPDPIEESEPHKNRHERRETMKSALVFAAIGEAVTGFALLIAPSLVGQLLLGSNSLASPYRLRAWPASP